MELAFSSTFFDGTTHLFFIISNSGYGEYEDAIFMSHNIYVRLLIAKFKIFIGKIYMKYVWIMPFITLHGG